MNNALRVMAEGNEDLPRDAQIVKLLLKSMGVEDYEPRVVHQFLELWYRYAADVLTDAQVYSEHAGKTGIDCDDVKLAVQSKVNFSFSQPPPREVVPLHLPCCILLRSFEYHMLVSHLEFFMRAFNYDFFFV